MSTLVAPPHASYLPAAPTCDLLMLSRPLPPATVRWTGWDRIEPQVGIWLGCKGDNTIQSYWIPVWMVPQVMNRSSIEGSKWSCHRCDEQKAWTSRCFDRFLVWNLYYGLDIYKFKEWGFNSFFGTKSICLVRDAVISVASIQSNRCSLDPHVTFRNGPPIVKRLTSRSHSCPKISLTSTDPRNPYKLHENLWLMA